ncbi:MAG: hypothetical protein ABIS50_08480 [Luteolibacter sp.]|uniref:hypothetical protein n=1 Tax=Luteolibacter sp. TaxID=1962973 RepID=UPI0032635151
MKNSWIIPVATLVVGAAGGYISGKGSGSGDSHSAIEESAQRTRSTRPEGSGASETTKKSRGANTEQIARMPGNSARIQALMDFYGGLTPDQLADEATKLDNLPMNERIMASILLFGRWAEVDPTAAMTFSNTMGFAGGFVRPTILQSWASVDPASAAQYYAKNPREFAMMGMMGGGGRGPMGGQDGAGIIASEWARQDPTAAMAWASSLTSGKGQAMSSVISEIAKTDPTKAAEMVKQMDPEDQAGAYRSVAAQYGAKDFVAAKNWIGTLPADEQAAALASAIGGLSNTDPVSATKQVALMEDGDAKDRVINDVMGDLSRQNPQAAADFLKEQTSERAQRDGMRELMPTWTNQNPAAALAYAESFPEGGVRDSAVQAYVWSNNTTAPADLIKAAETIGDEGDRDRTVGIAYMRWMREDATAAKAAVEASTTLSDDAKQRITEGRGMWGGGGPGGGGNGGGGNRRAGRVNGGGN